MVHFRLVLKDKKLMKDKKVKQWLRSIERIVQKEVDRKLIDFITFGSVILK
jgi:hypothetical protein